MCPDVINCYQNENKEGGTNEQEAREDPSRGGIRQPTGIRRLPEEANRERGGTKR